MDGSLNLHWILGIKMRKKNESLSGIKMRTKNESNYLPRLFIVSCHVPKYLKKCQND